jgi:hypothetical protein
MIGSRTASRLTGFVKDKNWVSQNQPSRASVWFLWGKPQASAERLIPKSSFDKVRGWLYQVTENAALDYIKSTRREYAKGAGFFVIKDA